MDGTGTNDLVTLKAVGPLAGGALNRGSTCGVVSGGCLALALARSDALESGDASQVAAAYSEFRDYTRWFERRFGSTLCRERTGTAFTSTAGMATYLFGGRFLTRCVAHAGPAADYLAERASRPLEAVEGRAEGGLCAAPVLRGIKEDVPLKTVSAALDGGVGLSGGLCGALAAALLPLGEELGIDPAEAGVLGTLSGTARDFAGIYTSRGREGLLSVGTPMVRGFKREFGSLECRDITGRTFDSVEELSEHMAGSQLCARVIAWCRERVSSRYGEGP